MCFIYLLDQNNLVVGENKFSFNTNIVQIATYTGESVMILDDSGDLYVYGQHIYGELGITNVEYFSEPRLLMSNVEQIACGLCFSLVLKTNGELYGYGDNSDKQLGLINKNCHVKFNLLITDNIYQIACGKNYSMILKQNGDLLIFGENNRKNFGTSRNYYDISDILAIDDDYYAPVTSNVVQIASGDNYSLFLKYNGDLFMYGDNNYMKRHRSLLERDHPILLMNGNIKQISCGKNHCMILKYNGDIFICGDNKYPGIFPGYIFDSPTLFMSGQINMISCIQDHSFILKKNGEIDFFGYGVHKTFNQNIFSIPNNIRYNNWSMKNHKKLLDYFKNNIFSFLVTIKIKNLKNYIPKYILIYIISLCF